MPKIEVIRKGITPAVKRAWNDPKLRKQILAALARLRTEIEQLTRAAKGGA